MDALAGLPDFPTLVATETAAWFAPYLGGSASVLPQRATLARDGAGNPELLLELFEAADDVTATGSHAVLNLTLGWDVPLDAALSAARASDPLATVQPLVIHRGFARLYPTASALTVDPGVLVPVELGRFDPNGARWTPRLSAAAGGLIKGALSGGTFLFGVRVEFDAAGVAQRAPAAVSFDAGILMNALLSGKPAREIAVADIVKAATAPASLPLKIAGNVTPEFAQALADRIVAAFGSLIAAPNVTDPVTIALADEAKLPMGTQQWDLSAPSLAYRQWIFTIDATDDIRTAVAKNGLDSFVKEIVAPPLETGVYRIDVSANLPPNRVNVPAIGATIAVAANIPFRPNSISEQVTLAEPDDSTSIDLHLSPAEALGFTVCGFAVITGAGSVQTYTAPAPRPCSATWVTLTLGDFPITFAHITASDRLLALSMLAITLTYTHGGAPVLQQFALSASTPAVAIGFPGDASEAALTLAATPAGGGTTLTLTPMPPGRFAVDLPLFAGYGPHTIDIIATLQSPAAPIVLELQSEERSADPTASGDLIVLTATAPSSTWGYVAASPFHSGYRYRRAATSSAPASAWSTIFPSSQLVLDAGVAITAPSAATPILH